MLFLKASCPNALTSDVVDLLRATPGAGAISCTTAVDDNVDIVQADIPEAAADALVAHLASLDGWENGEVTLTSVEDVERLHFANGEAITAEERVDIMRARQVRTMLRRLVRFDYEYALLMMTAALIATVGLIADLPIAIVGAMAFSPDLGRLNAIAFALLMRGRGLFWRGTVSLAAGMVVAIALSYVGTVILVFVGATDDALAGIPERLSDFVSVLDGFTIMVAIAAGIAAMIVFVADHGRAAVGVGVSITTIPAAAYVGIALASGAWTEAGNAGIVLVVNILCVVGGEVITGVILRKYLDLRRAHL